MRDLATLVALPTVSSDPRSAPAFERAAHLLATWLRRAGLGHVRILRPGGRPAVVGSTRPFDGTGHGRVLRPRPHVLLYAHYDVQPASGPGWTYPPFRLTRVDGRLLGRGTADDKGPLLAQLAAVETVLREKNRRLDVTVLLDGEEEIGSPSLPGLLRRLRGHLRPDVALVCDTRIPAPCQPAVIVSFRGSTTVEVMLEAPGGARHAGAYGGDAPDPAAALARLVASLHDRDGTLAVPGIHAGVPSTPCDVAWVRRTLRPAVVVTDLSAGSGATAIAARADARLNLRSAPGQRTSQVAAAVEAHLRAGRPHGLRLTLRRGTLVPPTQIPLDHPGMDAARSACLAVFGRPPALVRSGGTIAAVAYLQTALRTAVVPLGFVPPGSRVHAAGEHWSEALLSCATETVTCFLRAMSGR